jgi:drug/metabolite transporter (DMT)-like permease
LQLIGSTKASVLSTLEPVVTFACSALLLGESFNWLQLLGGAAVLSGAVLIVSGKEKEEAAGQAESVRTSVS